MLWFEIVGVIRRLPLAVGLVLCVGGLTGCEQSTPPAVPGRTQETPAAKLVPLAGDLSSAPPAPSKPSTPTILPLSDIPEPTVFVLKQLREKRADGALIIRQVKQYADGGSRNHGPYAEQRPDGTKYCEGQYEDGLRVGLWTFWHRGGQVAKTGHYKQGKPEGTWTFFGEDGSKQRVENYAAGRREGTWISYHPNGKPARQEEYQAGKRHGVWIEWYADGTKQVENHLSEDELDGVQMLWHRNGRPARQMEFKRGRRDGHFISWNEQGEKLSDLVYRNDVLVRSLE